MPLSIKTLLVLSIVLTTCQQEESKPAKRNDGATLKGQLVQNDRKEFQLKLDELATQLNQQVQLPQPDLPENWKDLKQEQRQAWFKKFNESEAGKALIKERQAVIDSAAKFKLKVEEDGNFTVFDVPFGTYGLRGRTEKEIDGKTFVFEVFGQISIAKEVEEVLLDPIMVSVTRILKQAETLPSFKLPTFDGKATIQNNLVKDKVVLFSFWSLDSPPSIEFSKAIQAAYKQSKVNHNIQLISVCVGSDVEKALAHVKKNNILGWHGLAKDWQDPIIEDFGIRAIPALCLSDNQGKFLMTPYDFAKATRVPDADLAKIIDNAITGKNIPTPAGTQASTPKSSN